MIVLRVLSYNGAPADGPAAQFDELGGTIGRADANQLVLPDPERTISRVHARVVCRAGGYAIVDNGSNPISVNGQALGAGREQPLKPGDQVQIGGYVIAAAAAPQAAHSDDPFADLFGDVPSGLAVPASSPSGGAAPWPAAVPPPAAAPAPPPPMAQGHLPDDWDPFAPAPAVGGALPAVPAGDAFADLKPRAPDSLDDLFGLSSGLPAGDPLGAAPEQLAQPNMASHADALRSLGRIATVIPASRSDHASELNTPMSLGLRPAPATAPAAPAAQFPAGAVFSWDDPPRDGRVVTLPGLRRVESDAVGMASSGTAPATAPSTTTEARPWAAPVSAAAPRADNELLAALIEGLGAPGLRLSELTPETLNLVGQLLRESLRGAVELLVARAALKREMRAEMTMIAARENNPLKFSPNVEVALQHLLGPPTPGFMPAAPAVRDAFDDLRAHQMGVMAGMRAALEGVLQRFDPQQLEAKLTRKSAIASLIPATRKARLWELFQDLFSQLQSEAQDDFDELFGKAFLRAYEDQLDRLQREPGPR